MKAYRDACGWTVLQARGAWRVCPVTIDVEYRAFRGCGGYHPRDEDNARSSLKAMVDSLQDAGLVRSDARANVRWGEFTLLTTKRACKGRAGITLTVRPQ